ncbi:hypothetical protein V499_05687 [Pseudogymnoascus sp. VKM F-103]|nr:hypothetical protein V499_05687 [Pseudogymnoascus sp. VKM F-103]
MAKSPSQILDELLVESRKGTCAMLGDDEGIPGDCICILDTMDLNSAEHGSRAPMQPFESPFIGWTDDECRSWINEHRHPYFAEYNFIVLDEDTVKNKTCRVGYTYVNEPMGDKMLTTDFFTCMHNMPAIDVGTLLWDETVLLGTGEVDDRAKFEEYLKEAHETYVRMESERSEKDRRRFPHEPPHTPKGL